jgi:hypothetical protein
MRRILTHRAVMAGLGPAIHASNVCAQTAKRPAKGAGERGRVP